MPFEFLYAIVVLISGTPLRYAMEVPHTNDSTECWYLIL